MTNAYCTLDDVKASLAGDGHNMGSQHDQSLVSKILEASRNIDREVAHCRGVADSFSFLADTPYSEQIIYLSSTPQPQDGTFLLMLGGQVTDPIDFDADAATVQSRLSDLSTAGDIAVSGFPGGPYTVTWQNASVGPQPLISGRASFDVSDAKVVVLPMIQGTDTVPSVRHFRPMAPLYGKLLVIDDCVEVESVSGGSSVGPDGDVLPYPLRGLPIEGLHLASGEDWPEFPATVAVTARWGYATSVPEDVRDICVIETIRSHFSSQAGNDDRLGLSPYGAVMTSKAFTSKFMKLKETYGHRLW